ncbi:PD-(D/E)XK motif protein [Mycobacterium marinum]|uniref:PD-(D/E)XK motif protein n=1 Tax=Mycobacterium marinum TaxID=1781 RepID=UPI002358F29C|nr:PD-(D/E)XK motif protein [Mycobacterium marinum]WCS17771.1 PD-(D/E)XK motif protein [Mycobacterium marinum]
MMDEITDARHLTFASLEMLWDGGAPLILPIQGRPRCEMEFDPDAKCITLVTDYQSPEPDLAKLQNISFEPMYVDDREVARITVRVDQNIHGAYGLLAVIADELQVAHSPLAAAVAAGVDQYREMLVARRSLTPEEEVGLVGELMFLNFSIHTIGVGPAIAAWQGPRSEEHDFTFKDIDLEVKTTVSERRRHVISGLTQLIPRPDIDLALLSIQLTRAGGSGGAALPSRVAQVRSLAGGHITRLDLLLNAAGWRSEDADLYLTRWTERSTPRAYLVDESFPAITAEALAAAVPNAGLLSEVSYRVDVTDLQPNNLPEPLLGFVESKRD